MDTTTAVLYILYVPVIFMTKLETNDGSLHQGADMPGTRSTSRQDWNYENNILTESDYYRITTLKFHDSDKSRTSRNSRSLDFRSGEATSGHSCDKVRKVPNELRRADIIWPNGLNMFYQKYTEAYGIPVIASKHVPDDVLKRACYVVRFVFADNYAVRNAYYKRSGRVAVIGVIENTTDIPEHSCLPESMNDRSRGLGATDSAPVCTGAEENIVCHCTDRWFSEDIFLHEIAHGVHLLGAKYGIDGWSHRLEEQYELANKSGLWENTYSMETQAEYFAEGVQSYFNVNEYQDQPNGIHGPISTRAKLKEYDPVLYQLIHEVFPCGNTYLKRCDSNRDDELSQILKMDCQLSDDSIADDKCDEKLTEISGMGDGSEITCIGVCEDTDEDCSWWASNGECTNNPAYMLHNCRLSCGVCKDMPGTDDVDKRNRNGREITPSDKQVTAISNDIDVLANATTDMSDVTEIVTNTEDRIVIRTSTLNTPDSDLGSQYICKDFNSLCSCWAIAGECRSNSGYMFENCKSSCGACMPVENGETQNCSDDHDECHFWWFIGECDKNPQYMYNNCKRSCNIC